MKYNGGILIETDRGFAMSTGNKLLFPNRGQDLTKGFITNITEIVDKDTYGFIKASQLTNLSEELNTDALVKFVGEHKEYNYYESYIINGVEVAVMRKEADGGGRFYIIVTTVDGEYYLISEELTSLELDNIIRFIRNHMYIPETTYSDKNNILTAKLNICYAKFNAETLSIEDAMVIAIGSTISKKDKLYLLDSKYVVIQTDWNDRMIYYDKNTKVYVSQDIKFDQLTGILPTDIDITPLDSDQVAEFRKEWLLADIYRFHTDDSTLVTLKEVSIMGTTFKFNVINPSALVNGKNIKFSDLQEYKDLIDTYKKNIDETCKLVGKNIKKNNLGEFSKLSLYNILTN